MTKTNQRISLTTSQYWGYFSYSILFSLPLLILVGQVLVAWLTGNMENVNQQNIIWVSNIWIVLILFTFYRRWNRLYYYEISARSTFEEFKDVLDHLTKNNRWKQHSLTPNDGQFYRLVKKGQMQKEWIFIKYFKDKILIASISNPSIIDFNRISNNQKNINSFARAIQRDQKTPLSQLDDEDQEEFWGNYTIYFFVPILIVIGTLGFFMDLYIPTGFDLKNPLIFLFFYGNMVYRFTSVVTNPNEEWFE